jgi:hypothetical protein
MENNHAHETGRSDLIHNIEDWATYLQRIVHLEKKAHHLLNTKNYKEAEEALAEIGHNSRMARVWIYCQESGND